MVPNDAAYAVVYTLYTHRGLSFSTEPEQRLDQERKDIGKVNTQLLRRWYFWFKSKEWPMCH